MSVRKVRLAGQSPGLARQVARTAMLPGSLGASAKIPWLAIKRAKGKCSLALFLDALQGNVQTSIRRKGPTTRLHTVDFLFQKHSVQQEI